MNIKDTYLGFTDNKKAMQAARMEKSLDMLWKMENGVFTRKQIVYDWLKEGKKPTLEKNYSYYSSRIDDYTKPRTLYKLENVEEGYYLEINKTLYDFANYILEHDFLNEEKAMKFIESERNEKEEQERIKQEKEQAEREQAEIRRKREEQERKEGLRIRQKEWRRQGRGFIDRLGHDPIKDILDKYVPMYIELDERENNTRVLEEEAREFYNNWYDRLLMMLGNYDLCNHYMKKYADDYKDGDFKEWEFRNIILFLEQRTLFAAYSNVELSDHVNTINAKMKSLYNNGLTNVG